MKCEGEVDDKVPDEEVALSGRLRRPREHDAGRAGGEPDTFHQLPGVAAEEELAKHSHPLPQEHHGSAAAHLLVLVPARPLAPHCPPPFASRVPPSDLPVSARDLLPSCFLWTCPCVCMSTFAALVPPVDPSASLYTCPILLFHFDIALAFSLSSISFRHPLSLHCILRAFSQSPIVAAKNRAYLTNYLD